MIGNEQTSLDELRGEKDDRIVNPLAGIPAAVTNAVFHHALIPRDFA